MDDATTTRPTESGGAEGGPAKPRLRRALNLPMLTLYGLGVTVGAGIYVLIGETAATAGLYAPAAFLIASIVVGFTAFSYAELSTRFPVSAGEAAFVEAGFRRVWPARLVGLAVASSGVVSASAVAIGAGGYLANLTGVSPNGLTIAIILIMALIAWWGVAELVAMAAVVTVIEILGLLAVVFWGFFIAEPNGAPISATIPPLVGDHWMAVGTASLLAFFAFVGFEDMVNVAEEVKDPRRTFPRAITITLIAATALYVAVSVSVLTAVPVDALASADAPLTLVFADAAPVVVSGFGAVAVFATANGVLIQLIMASRVLYGMADRGQLPRFLARVSPTRKTPSTATFFVAALMLVLSQALPIEQLAQHTSQIVLSVFIFVNAALIMIKLRKEEREDCFKVSIAVPMLGVLLSVLLFAMSMV